MDNMNNGKSFETTSRKLEQFLYAHDIMADSWHKDEDGLTVWCYAPTTETKYVVDEYRQIVARRANRPTAHATRGYAINGMKECI